MSQQFNIFGVVMLSIALSACGGSSGDADHENVSAAVTTQAVHQGDLPHVVAAYGTAVPALDAATTLSIHAEGAVTRFNVTAGAKVKRGENLLTFTLSPASVAIYQQALSAWNVARAARDHTAQLLKNQLATNDQMAQADKAMSDARATLDALRKQQGEQNSIELLAPSDGTISSIAAAQGDTLQPGAPLLSIARGNGIIVNVGVEFDPSNTVVPGDRAALTPIGAGATTTGTVQRIASILNPRTHLLDTDITPDGGVLPGMGYRADITVGQWHGWLVPRDATIGDSDGTYVFQVANGKAVKVAVTVLGESDTVSAVSGSLDASKPLVVVGNTQLDDGMAVRVTPPAEPAK
jgi:RND family efflux transporter MFP subunit